MLPFFTFKQRSPLAPMGQVLFIQERTNPSFSPVVGPYCWMSS
nr:MAG TPA: hypothetical protein [Caudoviricetes sp.]